MKKVFLFATKRLAVRFYQLGDAELLYEYSRQTSNKELPNEVLENLDNAKTYVEMALHSCKMGHFPMRYAIVLKETGEMIGALSYKATPERRVQICIMIAEQFQGKGYATEIAEGAIAYAKNKEGIEELYAIIRSGNTPAICVAENVGFILMEEYEADWFGSCVLFRKYKL